MPKRRESSLDLAALARLLEEQSGAVSRRQLLALGGHRADVRRMIARGELRQWGPGVYTTGPSSWLQRAWCAVLLTGPAALDRESALRASNGPGWRGRPDHLPIQVAIDMRRSVLTEHPDVAVRRVARLADKAMWNTRPPRMRPEEAVLDSAISLDCPTDQVEALARPVRARITTVPRILHTLAGRRQVRDRAFVEGVLADIRDGTHSVLERGYLELVERAHGLPTAVRQWRDDSGQRVVYRDAVYLAYETFVELDGRLDHTSVEGRDRDLDRDLHSSASGRRTVRLGWRQVYVTGCETARALGAILRRHGWKGTPHPCGPGCAVSRAA